MLDENQQCKNCGFDTMAIVTVDTSDWEYCPQCGSRFVSMKDDVEGNTDEEDVKMRKIPINGDENNDEMSSSDENADTASDTESGDSDSNNEEVQDGSDNEDDMTLEDLGEDTISVEEELDRLRKFVGDSDKDED